MEHVQLISCEISTESKVSILKNVLECIFAFDRFGKK